MSEGVVNKIVLEGFAPLLQVFDMPESIHFYRDKIGFEVVQSSGAGDDVDWVLMQYNDIQIMLNTAYEKQHRPEKPDPARVQAHQDMSLYFGCPDVKQTYELLKEKGVSLRPPFETGYGWNALEFNDPDGYIICMHWPKETESHNPQ